MRTVMLACALAAGTAWAVVTLSAPGAGTPTYNPVVLDLEDRLASLEGRIARSARDEQPGLRSIQPRADQADALARRVAALEKELARLRKSAGTGAAGSEATATQDAAQREAERAAAHAEARAAAKRKTPRVAIAEARERARRLPAGSRARLLVDLAKRAGKSGLFELQEALLRETVETAGRDNALAQEALYNIGWSRKNRGDAAGAREAWLAASNALPRDHWRQGYARLYAAEQGIDAGEEGEAARELHDLLRDIEARPKVVDPHGTLIKRGRALLATLER